MSEDPRTQLAQLQVQHVALLALVEQLRARLADAERALLCHEGAPVAIVTVDASTRIIAANAAARSLLALSANGSASLDALVAPPNADELRVLVKAAFAGTPMHAELSLRGESGRVGAAEERAEPSLDRRMLVTATAQSSTTVTCALVELPRYAHDALANLHAFANGLTHELNNKLQGVTANIELALSEGPDLQAELLADALGAAESIGGLSAQLNAYASGHTLTRRAIELSTMLRVLEPVARAHAGTATLMLEVCDTLDVHGDVAQLSRAVLSLVEHARDAGAARISITLSAWDATAADIAALDLAALPAGRYAVIAVRDHRAALPAGALDRQRSTSAPASAADPRRTSDIARPGRRGSPRMSSLDVAETIIRGHRGALTVASMPTGEIVSRVLLPLIGV